MADFIATRPQLHPDGKQSLGVHGPVIRRGQPLMYGPGQALPVEVYPVLPGYVRFTTREGGLFSLDMLTTGEPYMLPEGFAAGWDTVQRRDRVARLKWTGGAGLRQAVPVTMDVLHVPRLDIEREWRLLRHLARPADGTRPPMLRIAGPVDHKDVDWVIVGFDIDSSEQTGTRRRGHRMVRQPVLITLGQWTPESTRATLKRVKPTRDKPRVVESTGGRDTLKKLAKYYLHDTSRWRAIAKLNKGLQDPDRHIPVGTKVSIPPR